MIGPLGTALRAGAGNPAAALLLAVLFGACGKGEPARHSSTSSSAPDRVTGRTWVDSGVMAVAFSSTRFSLRHVVVGASAELELLDRNSPGHVLDRVKLAAPDSAVFAHDGCRERQRHDALLVGLVRHRGTPRLEAVAAWRVDTLGAKLVAVDHSKVTCVNENYGV